MKARIITIFAFLALGAGIGITVLPKLSGHGQPPKPTAAPGASANAAAASLAATPLITFSSKVVDGQQVTATAMSESGNVALATANGDVFTYGLPGSAKPGLSQANHVTSGSTALLAFSGDGRKLAGATTEGKLWELDLQSGVSWTGQADWETSPLPFTESAGLALNSNGSMLAVDDFGTNYVYQITEGFLIATSLQYSSHQSEEFVFSAPVFSPDGTSFAVPGPKRIDVWSVGTGAQHSLAPDCPCEQATINASWTVAAMYRTGYIEIRSLTSNNILDEFPSQNMQGLAFNADGSKVAWADGHDQVQVASLRNGGRPLQLHAAVFQGAYVQLASGGRLLLVAPIGEPATIWRISQ
jgi:hypothetical protein